MFYGLILHIAPDATFACSLLGTKKGVKQL